MQKEEVTKILLVEDNNDVLTALRMLLELDGFKVIGAHDGAEGFQTYRNEHPDLVITDLNMPSVDGLQLINMIRADRFSPKTPIIVISAHDDKGDNAKAAGANHYLHKPYDYDQLRELIGYLRPEAPDGIAA